MSRMVSAGALAALTETLSVSQMRSLVYSIRKKIALWSGAVSAGKTFISLWAFLMAIPLAPKGGNIIIVGRTLDTIYTNIFVLLQSPEIFGDLAKQVIYTRGAKTAIILGRVVHLYGANDASSETKIRGSTVGLAYVDELTILPEGFWDMLMTRLRVKGARCLATTNPGSKNHWLRKKWILKASEKNLIHFPFTMDDNPSLDAEYVADMKVQFAGVFYDRFIRGLWTNAEGAVYNSWDEKKHMIRWQDMPPIARVLALGADYGTTNTTAALLLGITAEERPRLVLMDEWSYSSKKHHGHTLSDAQLSARLLEWLDNTEHSPHGPVTPEMLILDPSAASLRAQLAESGRNTWPAHNRVDKGIGLVASLLSAGALLITDRCEGVLEEITEYSWDPKATEAGEDKVEKVDDHFMDAMRYAIYTTRSTWLPYLRYALAA
ncbi:PBSX family phage terminase large subunit [Mycetocola spongiae]|uniref:PBSX family phage terminase large subunit n=1 Tax=Mycetocola spongiae TaxID=2859226 RepID=UPI001CF4EDD9|nr:PBSX family phage terminase large subunit [Mycetocola spongiae]UCR89257.1 PBSX family phage terminase large subunit [Mycetocola spongiae]